MNTVAQGHSFELKYRTGNVMLKVDTVALFN